MDCWIGGVMDRSNKERLANNSIKAELHPSIFQYSIIPLFQHSNTPLTLKLDFFDNQTLVTKDERMGRKPC